MRQTSRTGASGRDIELFSTCVHSRDEAPAGYLERVVETARWSDDAGYRGMLVYTDNGIVDPWLVSQVVLPESRHSELAALAAAARTAPDRGSRRDSVSNYPRST